MDIVQKGRDSCVQCADVLNMKLKVGSMYSPALVLVGRKNLRFNLQFKFKISFFRGVKLTLSQSTVSL